MQALPRPDFSGFNNSAPQKQQKFKTPSPLKEIKIGPTQTPPVNRVRSYEQKLTDSQAQFNGSNSDLMRLNNRQYAMILEANMEANK